MIQDVHHEVGTSSDVRQRFAKSRVLPNQTDSNLRGIIEDEPVFAFAKSFSLGAKGSDSVMFTIAYPGPCSAIRSSSRPYIHETVVARVPYLHSGFA